MKKFGKVVLLIVVICTIFGLIGYNYSKCKSVFFSATLLDILNLIFIAVFTYFLVELKSDERKRKECIENLINKLYLLLDDSRLYKIENEEHLNYIRIVQRSIKSKIGVLRDFDCKNIKLDVEHISNEFEEYWKIISEDVNDINKLKELKNTLFRHINNIQNNLDEIIVKLY